MMMIMMMMMMMMIIIVIIIILLGAQLLPLLHLYQLIFLFQIH